MRIAFASDHAGFALKRELMARATAGGHEVEDFGCRSEEAADVSDHVEPAAVALGQGKFARAIFVDGAGYPSGIVANMCHGVFAAVCNDPVSAKFAREHGGANALCMGAMIVGKAVALEIFDVFMKAEALGGKYAARRDKVVAIGKARRLGPLRQARKVITIDDLRRAIELREPLVIDDQTVITPSVQDAIRYLKP